MRKTVCALSIVAVAFAGRAQQGAPPSMEQDLAEPTQRDVTQQRDPAQRDMADRCVALLQGELGRVEAGDLSARCADLVRAGADRGQPGQTELGAGVARETPTAGASVRTAFANAGRELIGQREGFALGRTRGGTVGNTLMTNPLGWFSGLGVNVSYIRPISQLNKLSWVASGRYAHANASNGDVTTFGIGGGVDLFLIGRNNEGLRIGPRLELAFGSEDVQGTSTFARVGASGEIGYNFIAGNGITGAVAGGLGTRLAGDEQNESFDSFTGGELGPYLKLGLGYSW